MKILVTGNIPDAGIDLLKKEHEVERYSSDHIITKQELLEKIVDKEGVLCLLTDPIDHDVISAGKKLRMISNFAVGYDNIDIAAATEKGIPVSNTPDVLTETTAEMAWALLFAVGRRIVEGDNLTRSGNFHGWGPQLLLGQDVHNKTLGIIGSGRIGTAFARKSKGFRMHVLYVDEHVNTSLESELGAKKVTLDEVLSQSDFISLHVPLTDETYHLIGEQELRRMKKNAVLINTARGPVIDEQALIKALQEKWIFGAGLDVFEHEPTIPQELLALDNVVVQPHAGSGTLETRTKMAIMAAENMIQGLRGEKPNNCVNPEVFST